jgi:hypothetical protein
VGTTSKQTSDTNTKVVNKFIDLTLGDGDDNNNSKYGFNTEDYRGNKSGDESCYGDSFDNHSSFNELDHNLDDIEVEVRVLQVNNPQVNDSQVNNPQVDERVNVPQVDEGDPSNIYLTKKDFNYAMDLVDKKLTSIYKLCKFMSDVQQDEKKSLEKLVALDELSESFWNVRYI